MLGAAGAGEPCDGAVGVSGRPRASTPLPLCSVAGYENGFRAVTGATARNPLRHAARYAATSLPIAPA